MYGYGSMRYTCINFIHRQKTIKKYEQSYFWFHLPLFFSATMITILCFLVHKNISISISSEFEYFFSKLIKWTQRCLCKIAHFLRQCNFLDEIQKSKYIMPQQETIRDYEAQKKGAYTFSEKKKHFWWEWSFERVRNWVLSPREVVFFQKKLKNFSRARVHMDTLVCTKNSEIFSTPVYIWLIVWTQHIKYVQTVQNFIYKLLYIF